MAYLDPKTVPVPAQNSAANNFMQDVIGNKTDLHTANSLYALIKTLVEDTHATGKVYPSLANGKVVTGGAAWTLGVFAEIVPAGFITSNFDIHGIGVEALSANDIYEIVLYKGALASEIEVGRIRVAKNAVQAATTNQLFKTLLINANERISAKIATAGGGDTATLSVFYHTY